MNDQRETTDPVAGVMETIRGIFGDVLPAEQLDELERDIAEQEALAIAQEVIAEHSPDVRTCRVCGCTDQHACEGGCYWVGPALCSRCAAGPADRRIRKRHGRVKRPSPSPKT